LVAGGFVAVLTSLDPDAEFWGSGGVGGEGEVGN
jgi:hypothetical protein